MGRTLQESKTSKTTKMTAEIPWKQFYGKSNKVTKQWKATLETQKTYRDKIESEKGDLRMTCKEMLELERIIYNCILTGSLDKRRDLQGNYF